MARPQLLLLFLAACGGDPLLPAPERVTTADALACRACSEDQTCIRGHCLPPAQAGGPCASPAAWLESNCVAGTRCIDGTCQPPREPGQACQLDWDCRSSICALDVCAAPGAVTLGGACVSEADCGPDLTCLEGLCFAALPAGARCDRATASCADGLACWKGICGAL